MPSAPDADTPRHIALITTIAAGPGVALVFGLLPLLAAGTTPVLFVLAAWEHYNASRCFRHPPEIDTDL